jgi:hypothetical protein
LRFLLGEDHIKGAIIEEITNAVCIAVYYLCIYLSLSELILLKPLSFYWFFLELYPTQFCEGLALVFRKAADYYILLLVVLVADELFELLPVFEMSEGNVLRDHSSQSVGN